MFFLPLLLTKKNRNNLEVVAQGKVFPSLKELFSILLTFSLTVFAWIFFRAENLSHAVQYILDVFKNPGSFLLVSVYMKHKVIFLLLFLFVLVEWFGREGQYAIAHIGIKWKRPFRYALYYVIIIAIIFFGGKEQQFIYFQF